MRKLYIGVITLITIVCVIVGVSIHLGGGIRFINGTIITEDNSSISEEDIELDAFTKISVDTDVMGLTIKTGNEFTFSYNCTKNLVPEYEVKDGVLYITQENKNKINFGTNNCEAVLTIPKDTVLEEVKITSDVGDVVMDDLTVNDLTVICDVGDVNIDETIIGDAKLELDVGDLDITNSRFENIDVASDVGDVDIHSVADLSEHSFDVITDVGDVDVNGKEYKKEYRVNEGTNLVKLVVDVGDIDISWENE